jgi:hypothetical protein|nr:hypothetical protein Q903MT_gene1013 [Picea sitchensis]
MAFRWLALNNLLTLLPNTYPPARTRPAISYRFLHEALRKESYEPLSYIMVSGRDQINLILLTLL